MILKVRLANIPVPDKILTRALLMYLVFTPECGEAIYGESRVCDNGHKIVRHEIIGKKEDKRAVYYCEQDCKKGYGLPSLDCDTAWYFQQKALLTCLFYEEDEPMLFWQVLEDGLNYNDSKK